MAVFVCGAHPALGAWEPSNAVRLYANEKNPLLWSTEETMPVWLPLRKAVEYNYLVKEVDAVGAAALFDQNTLSSTAGDTLRSRKNHRC